MIEFQNEFGDKKYQPEVEGSRFYRVIGWESSWYAWAPKEPEQVRYARPQIGSRRWALRQEKRRMRELRRIRKGLFREVDE